MKIAGPTRSRGEFAVIGGGVSGLACARTLIDAGFCVTVLDKGRRPGGRVSSRTIEDAGCTFSFDYGAQYFTARHPLFRSVVKGLEKKSLVAPWPIEGKNAWVGTPGMATLVEALADGIDVAWGQTATGLVHRDDAWVVKTDETGERNFENVVLAMPAEQTAVLAATADFGLAHRAVSSQTNPCWTLLLGFSVPLPIDEDVLQGDGISSATRNIGKPSRHGCEAWVIHADPDWSRRHLEKDPAEIRQLLGDLFASAAGHTIEPIYARAHRWRYALSSSGSEGCYWNDALKLGACGDWLLAPRIESAWISGRMLGEQIAGGEALV